jgi:hypothetical protein
VDKLCLALSGLCRDKVIDYRHLLKVTHQKEENLIRQRKDAQDAMVGLQSELERTQQDCRKIELQEKRKAEDERRRQEDVRDLLAQLASPSDDQDVIDVIDEIEEWLSAQPFENGETSVSSN